MMKEVADQLQTLDDIKCRLQTINEHWDHGGVLFDQTERFEILEAALHLLDKYPDDEDVRRIGILFACGYYTLKSTVHYPFRWPPEDDKD